MSKLMYDSVDARLIPRDAPVVSGYGDGLYRWSPNRIDGSNWFDLFPSAIKVVTVCFPGSQGDILDIEAGCASPADVPGWLDRYNRPVFKVPTLYVNRGNWDAVRALVGSRTVDYWVATLDGTQTVAGAAAVQYIDTGAYDISLCQDFWPRIPEEKPMPIIIGAPNRPAFLLEGKLWVGIADSNDVTALQAAGVKEVTVSTALFDAINAAQTAVPPAGTVNVDLSPVTQALAALKADLDGLTFKKV